MKMINIMVRKGFALLVAAGIAIPGYGDAIAADHTGFSLEQEVGVDGIVLINDLEKIDYSPFLVYLNQSSGSPEEYILSKYGDHDIVILGEAHEVRENCELISGLIKPLYHKAGVRYFATEFLRSKNNLLANQLVTGEEYDHELELRICRDYAWPIWGFREYMSIFESVWELNRSLPADAEKIKVVGLDSEWDAYDSLFEPANVDANQFWLEREKHMTDVLEKEVIEKEGKALVHMGYAHTLPCKYIRPTLGNWISERHRNKSFQICLHHDHQGSTGETAIIPLIERIMEENNNKPVGFDVQNSPFSPLRDQSSIYFSLVDDIVFSDIAQGYVFMKPVKDLRKVTWVHGFIGESNFEKARAIALKSGWIGEDECKTPEEMDSKMAQIFGLSVQPEQRKHVLWGNIKCTALLRNYPNPCNPDTWIPYQLASDSHVTIRIYDISGKLARTLDIGQREAGFHTERQKAAYWDGRNQQGEAVGSGVYFYQLVTDDGYSPARKMLMTK